MPLPARRSLLAALLATLVTTACDETFQPIEPSDVKFSVFGYLDASADTQWIRIMPLRAVVTTTPEPLRARVTLEHLGTGRTIELRDSIFRFGVPEEIDSEGRFLHNFWTTEPIQPGAAYRFAVDGDGVSSGARIEIPPAYSVEVWLRQAQSEGDRLRLSGLKHVALVQGSMYFTDDCGSVVEHASFPYSGGDSGVHSVPIVRQVPRPRLNCGEPFVDRLEIRVAGSGSVWPTSRDHIGGTLNVPDELSNISSSVGFLGGVLTRTLPYEECLVLAGGWREHCRLRYDESSATLTGTVTDLVCGGGVAGAEVQLREIDPEPPVPPKLRSTRAGRTGRFEIGALEAGRRYALTARRVVAGFDRFQEYGDTLQFAPGERVTREIMLRPVDACPR